MKKNISLLSLLLVMVMALSGCKAKDAGLGTKYQEYIDGIMACSYYGQTDKYTKVTDATAQEAKDVYDGTVEYYAYQRMSYNDVDSESISEEMLNKYIELARAVMGKVKYTVYEATKVGEDWQVKIDIEPIDFNDITWDAVEACITDFNAKIEGVDLNAMSDEEWLALEEQYAQAVLDTLNSYVSSIGYKEVISKVVVITVDKDGYYGIADSEWNDIDDTVVDMNY